MANKIQLSRKLNMLLIFSLTVSIAAFAQSKDTNVEAVLSRIRAAGISSSETGRIFAIVDSFYQVPVVNKQDAELRALVKHTGDTLIAGRLSIYYMANKLAENCNNKPESIKEKLLVLFSKGTNDGNALIRQQVYDYLMDNECWFSGIAKDKDVLQSFEKMFTVYKEEVPIGLFRIIGEQELRGLVPAIKQAYYSKPAGNARGGSDLYDSRQWAAMFLLGRWGDTQSIDYILSTLNKETDPELKYRELAKVCISLSGKKVTGVIYKTVMSPEVEQQMEPIGKGDSYSPTYFSHFLMEKLPVLFKEFPVAEFEKLKIKNSSDKDLDKKLLTYTRTWLKSNRSKFQ